MLFGSCMLAAIAAYLLGFMSSMQLVGPIALIVLRNALKQKYGQALSVSLGASIAEGCYCFLAIIGFDFVFEKYPFMKDLTKGFAVVVLFGLGFIFYFTKPLPEEIEDTPMQKRKAVAAFFLGFSVTMVNPLLIVSWSAVAAMLYSVIGAFTRAETIMFPVFMAAGMFTCLSLLIWLIKRYKKKFRPAILNKVLKVMAVLLILGGAYLGVRLLLEFI